MKQAPYTYQVSCPPDTVDLTRDALPIDSVGLSLPGPDEVEKPVSPQRFHVTSRTLRENLRQNNIVSNDPKVNQFMIQEGKNKIMTLKGLGNIRPQVMDKLNEIVKPIDERREFKKYWHEKAK